MIVAAQIVILLLAIVVTALTAWGFIRREN